MNNKAPPPKIDHRETAEQMLKLPDYHETTEPESGTVKVAPGADGGTIDLAKELAPSVKDASLPPQADPTVRDALERLKKGTKKGLNKTDHYDLGVAYMSMGLVDEAVREFNAAGVDPDKRPRAGKTLKAASAAKAGSKGKARGRKKAAPAKRPAKRRKR